VVDSKKSNILVALIYLVAGHVRQYGRARRRLNWNSSNRLIELASGA